MAALLPLANRPETIRPHAAVQEPSDFMKLIDSLIGGEVASLSPTQFHGQDKSVVLSGKGQEVNNADTRDASKGQKNPKDSSELRDPNDQQSGGLLAMMAAVPSARTKPTLSLNFGRSAGEDSFVKSSKTTEGQDFLDAPEVASPAPAGCATPKQSDLEFTPIVPSRPSDSRNRSPAQDQDQVGDRTRNQLRDQPKDQAPDLVPASVSASAQDTAAAALPVPATVSTPTSNPASTLAPVVIPVAISVPVPMSHDTPPRSKLELSTGSRQAPAPALPLALRKVRTEGPASTEPIAFAARLTEREEPEDSQSTKPSIVQRGQKQPSLSQPSQPQVQGKADQENVPTNPKSTPHITASQPSSEPTAPKTKPVEAEHAAENVPTNPKSPAALAVPARETPVHGPQSATKSTSAPEVKGSASAQETELQAKPTIRSEPAREISIRIPSAGNGSVDVRIVERDGKVQVTVRGSDTQLNSALRGELTELVHTLDQKGYKTETWTPGDSYPLTSASTPEVRTPGRSESSPDGSGNQSNDGGNGGNPSENQQQRRQQQERPDWLIELERRLETEG